MPGQNRGEGVKKKGERLGRLKSREREDGHKNYQSCIQGSKSQSQDPAETIKTGLANKRHRNSFTRQDQDLNSGKSVARPRSQAVNACDPDDTMENAFENKTRHRKKSRG